MDSVHLAFRSRELIPKMYAILVTIMSVDRLLDDWSGCFIKDPPNDVTFSVKYICTCTFLTILLQCVIKCKY